MSEFSNPLLASLKIPGRTFQLPSRGLLYTNGELAETIKEAELHFRPLSAFDEITLKNPDMLFNGQALQEVFPACAKGILKPNELLGKDVDAIMLFLRLVTYGPLYEISANHHCENGIAHSYEINLESLLHTIKYIDPTTIEEKYTLHLDNGQVVKIQPIKYQHIIEILQANNGKKNLTVQDSKDNLVINLLNIIKSIDGIDDKELIKEWITMAPAQYVNMIADAVESTNDWGLDLNATIKCKDCGEEFDILIPINTLSFFS